MDFLPKNSEQEDEKTVQTVSVRVSPELRDMREAVSAEMGVNQAEAVEELLFLASHLRRLLGGRHAVASTVPQSTGSSLAQSVHS